jgi:hypothetical protein
MKLSAPSSISYSSYLLSQRQNLERASRRRHGRKIPSDINIILGGKAKVEMKGSRSRKPRACPNLEIIMPRPAELSLFGIPAQPYSKLTVMINEINTHDRNNNYC